MISATVTARGDSGTRPFEISFEYDTEADEKIFRGSVRMIRDRISGGLRININEAAVLIVDIVVLDIRKGRTDEEIRRRASRYLGSGHVIFGVAEGLRHTSIVIRVDDHPERSILLSMPIPVCRYALGES